MAVWNYYIGPDHTGKIFGKATRAETKEIVTASGDDVALVKLALTVEAEKMEVLLAAQTDTGTIVID